MQYSAIISSLIVSVPFLVSLVFCSSASASQSASSSSSNSSSHQENQDTQQEPDIDSYVIAISNVYTEKAAAILKDLTGRYTITDGQIQSRADEAEEAGFFEFSSGLEYIQVLRTWALLKDNPFAFNNIALVCRKALCDVNEGNTRVIKCQFGLKTRRIIDRRLQEVRSLKNDDLVDPQSVTTLLVHLIDGGLSDTFTAYLKDNFFNDADFAHLQLSGTEELPPGLKRGKLNELWGRIKAMERQGAAIVAQPARPPTDPDRIDRLIHQLQRISQYRSHIGLSMVLFSVYLFMNGQAMSILFFFGGMRMIIDASQHI